MPRTSGASVATPARLDPVRRRTEIVLLLNFAEEHTIAVSTAACSDINN